jgi:hypothetical protein
MWVQLSFFLAALVALAVPVRAQETDYSPKRTIESPSPDGRFAFLAAYTAEKRTLDLIEKDSGKVLLRVAESEEGTNRLSSEALWAPDSKRVALWISIYRREADLSVYFREGDTFREIKLPALPAAKLPKKVENDKKHFWHMAVGDWAKPVRWLKDGSLIVESESVMDGNGNTATATRTTVLGFDRSGAAKIVKSTQEVKIDIAPGD